MTASPSGRGGKGGEEAVEDRGDRSRGARGGRHDRRRARRRRRRCRRCQPAMRKARAENLVSCSPASRRTGTPISSSRSHTGSWAPVPRRRSAEASPSTVPIRRSSTPASDREQAGEQGLGQPAVDELLDALALQAGGEPLVDLHPGGPGGWLPRSRRWRRAGQRVDEVGPVERHPQGQAPARASSRTRSPASGPAISATASATAPAAASNGSRARAERAPGRTMPGQGHPDDLVRRVEPGHELVPRAGPLGEAVQQHEPPARPTLHAHIDVGHDRRCCHGGISAGSEPGAWPRSVADELACRPRESGASMAGGVAWR